MITLNFIFEQQAPSTPILKVKEGRIINYERKKRKRIKRNENRNYFDN